MVPVLITFQVHFISYFNFVIYVLYCAVYIILPLSLLDPNLIKIEEFAKDLLKVIDVISPGKLFNTVFGHY